MGVLVGFDRVFVGFQSGFDWCQTGFNGVLIDCAFFLFVGGVSARVSCGTF